MHKKFIALLFISTNVFAQTNKTMKRLPDTGQNTSYTTTFGEDNDYSFNTPFFINNNDGTITDTITTLMWQSTDGGEMTLSNALLYCDTLILGGNSDWRLPTAQESYSILNHQNNNPALNTIYFTNTGAEYWWTSERQANDTNKIWVTNAGGGIGNHLKTETLSAGGTKKFHVRAVRDVNQVVTIPFHYTDNGDSTITDNLTNLIWQKFPNPIAQTWEQAIIYAESLSLTNNNDWRLPNIKELQSLNDESGFSPSVTTPYFQNLGVQNFWSSTSLPNQTTKAWYWNTAYGITTYDTKTNTNYVLCVRNKTTAPSSLITHNLNENNIKIFPNPAESKLIINIKNKQTGIIKIMLLNSIGQQFLKQESISNQIDINIANLPKGIYLLSIHQNLEKYTTIVSIK